MEDNNNLEKFFRDKFNQKVEPQDWNIPDNEVWDNIASNIPTKDSKRRFGFLPFVIAGALLLLSVYLAYDNFKKGENIVELEQELIECGNSIGSSDEATESSDNINMELGNVSNQSNIHDQNAFNRSNVIAGKNIDINSAPKSIQSQKNPSNFQEKSSENRNQTSENQNFDKNTPAFGSPAPSQENLEEIAVKSDQKSAVDKQNLALTSQNLKNSSEIASLEISSNDSENTKESISSNFGEKSALETIQYPGIADLKTMPILPFSAIKSESSTAPNPLIEVKIIEPVASTASFRVGPVAQYMHWQSNKHGSFENPLSELLVNEETNPSIALGIGINKRVGKRVLINTGLLYYHRNQTSQYAINLPYSTTDEINVGSEFENSFEHSLPTSLGSIDTRLVLARSLDSPVTNNENVYLDFSLQNHTKALAIPLTISYYFNRAGQGFFVQGGIMNEIIIANELKKINAESHHTHVKDKSIEVDYSSSQIDRFNVVSTFGLGYERVIMKDLSVSFLANYGLALTNTFSIKNYQHKINHVGLQLMISKRLN